MILVTGSTDGIGRQTARQLAAGGLRVIVHGRSKPKVDATLDALRGELPGAELSGVAFDVGTLAGVRRGVEQIGKLVDKLDVLVNNAGIFATERVITEDGLEATFAVNYLGPFLLTELLLPRRVINVASVAHTRGRIHLDDLQLGASWTGYAAYAQSKLANVMHAISLGERHPGLTAYSLHPGVVGTKLLRQGFGPVQGTSVEAGAQMSVRLAATPSDAIGEPSGTYFSDGVATPPSAIARDPQMRAALWDASLRLAKL